MDVVFSVSNAKQGRKHPADPTPRSAGDVLADRGYKMVARDQSPTLGTQPTNTLVMLHCGTETYWMTTYLVTQANMPTNWHQVAPVVETSIIYRPIRG